MLNDAAGFRKVYLACGCTDLRFCIGKKNREFIDTVNGAKSSAVIYSIAETA